MIQALVFDFDGLLVDTETPALESWQQIYAEYGCSLSLDVFQHALGTSDGFNALDHLEELLGHGVDRAAVAARRRTLKTELSKNQPLLPGVESILTEAQTLGLACAVASSSDRGWVERWLKYHNIRHFFACVRTADDVIRTKPAPDLFLSTATCLNITPPHCLVFEDSPNGILAARAAGMRCVVIPGAVTQHLTLPAGDLVLPSLHAIPLDGILAHLA
jgi:HAD superfamily hydrolase (TIGR01509 family)